MGACRVFATGLGGSIGPAVARALAQAGFAVRALRHRRPLPPGPEPVDGDLAADWNGHEALAGADAVVHFGALMQGTVAELRAVNVEATAALARAAAAAGVRRFVLASSAAVYAPGTFADADESHAVGPTDPYDISKLHAERAARSALPGDLVCLRLPSVYGGRAGCPMVRKVLAMARAARLPRGSARLDIVHADDVGQCVVRALAAARADGVFHAAGPDRPTFEAAMTALARLQGLEPTFVDPAGGDANGLPADIVAIATVERTLSTQKARRVLGYAPVRGWATLIDCARELLASPGMR
jgi:nucleoside-diphosphate-sugar epimerase